MYQYLESKLCKELSAIEEKYHNGAELSEGDLRRIDLLIHSLKSLATYGAMKEAEEPQYDNSYSMDSSYTNKPYMYNSGMNNSYARGRNGRYMSRDMGPDMSGHYPMYPEDRRW